MAGLAALAGTDKPWVGVFRHGTLEVEFYKPQGVDRQQPHTRDEVYVVLSGRGTLEVEGDTLRLHEGDAAFVPAGADHRFTGYEGLSVLVVFAGTPQ